MTKDGKLKRLFYFIVSLSLLIVAVLSGRVVSSAFAAMTDTSVLADLQTDTTFDINDYPSVDDDYSLQVIRIAESPDGELFVYVYQPAAKTKLLTATDLNMSLAESVDDTKLYQLSLISAVGVFQKYLVDDVSASSDEVRYYNITSIYREWIEGIDEETGNDNTKNEIAYAVGKCYKVEIVDGSLNYSCIETQVIEILNPYVDFVSYYKGLTWASVLGLEGMSYTDVHYIAFSTDWEISLLKEAEITYTTQSYTYQDGKWSYGSKSNPQYKTLTGDMEISASKYTWKCIQPTSDFIETVGLNDTTKANIQNTDFVLVFLTTSYSEKTVSTWAGHQLQKTGTKVSEVAILRLEFETDGISYNLGVVSDKITGDDIPGNQHENKNISFWAYIWHCLVAFFTGTATFEEIIVAIITIIIGLVLLPLLIFLLYLLAPLFKTIIPILGKGVVWIFKHLVVALWCIVSAPFKGIVSIVHKIRGN